MNALVESLVAPGNVLSNGRQLGHRNLYHLRVGIRYWHSTNLDRSARAWRRFLVLASRARGARCSAAASWECARSATPLAAKVIGVSRQPVNFFLRELEHVKGQGRPGDKRFQARSVPRLHVSTMDVGLRDVRQETLATVLL